MSARSLVAPGIELDRQFLDLPKSAEELDPEDLFQAATAIGKASSWADLLASRYVVVLGEAGTGKSTEFRRRAALLSNAGAHGFFLELASLAADGVSDSVLPEEEEQLKNWMATTCDAVFFLDSLDEAKLQRRTLRDALRKLKRELRDQWERVRLVVSCRVSDWRDSDRSAVEEVVPQEQRSGIRVVQIAPLDEERVARLADHRGVQDSAGFMRAVAASYAQAFAHRPLDVEWLGAYWSRHSRIGQLRELFAVNVDEKLKQHSPERSASLSLVRSRAGAEALAGIGSLTRRLSVALPGEPVDLRRSQDAIDTREVLADWSPTELDELLRSGLFDESTYGRVRFHLRAVQDYLAARWLHDLRKAGLPLDEVRDLFFIEEAGERVVPQHLGPVLAWLCLWDDELRVKVIEEAPVLLIAFGDPSGLSEEDRVQTLRAYAASYKKRTRLFNDFEDASLERFATPALEEAVRILLGDQGVSDEFVALLLELVELGRIRGCLPEALGVALDVEQGNRPRIAAIRAVVALGGDEHRRRLLALLDGAESWSQDVAGAFVRGLYPEVLDVEGLIQVLERCERKPKNFATLLQGVLEYEVPKLGDPAQRLQLLENLLDLVHVTEEQGKSAVAPGRDWLLRTLGHLLGSVLDDLPAGSQQPEAVAQALDFFRWCDEQGMRIYYGVDQAREAVARHPEVRRGLFWQRVAQHRDHTGQIPRSPFELRYRHDLFELSSADVEWLSQDASSRSDVRERLLAFDTLAFLPRSAEGNEQYLDMLRCVARTHPALQKRLERLLRRTPMQHPEEGKWERRRRAHEMRSERAKKENRQAVTAEIDSIRSGANPRALWFLLRQAQEKGLGNRWGEASMESLRELYGDDIAEAAEQGWRAFWRTGDPSLPHERERNTTPGDVIVGLAGLTMDFELGLDAGSLTEAQITKVVRYAANELNGFPKWFGELAAAQPDSVRAALRPCLEADYQADEDVHGVLAKLPWAEPPVKEACAPAVLELILEKDPPTLKALKEALGAVLAVEGVGLAALDAIIAERCQSARGDVRRLAVWWLVWAGREGVSAMDFLESLLSSAERNDAYEVALEICHRIHDGIERLPIALRHDVGALTRLIPLVYKFIDPKDDIDHEDAFTPGQRDNAQEVRSLLVKWLADTSGTEAVKALRQIADDPRLACVREWVLHQADLRSLANAEARRPDVIDVLVTLYREHGLDARNHVALPSPGVSIVKILLIGSNPRTDDLDPLAIDEEARDIEIKLRASEHREAFRLKWRGAARPLDLQQILLEERPTIVHFSGHGAGADGLIFHSDRSGEDLTVTSEALRDLFRIHGKGVRVVVLNACDSVAQARVLREVVDFVVGMQDEIDDDAARIFAAAFYRGLGFGSTVQDAFDQGVLDLRLAGMTDDAAVPTLLAREGLSAADSTLVADGGGR